jgi:hypothetical protein
MAGQVGQFEEDTAPQGRGNDAGDEEIVLFDHRADDARQRDFVDLARCGTRGNVVHFMPGCQISENSTRGLLFDADWQHANARRSFIERLYRFMIFRLGQPSVTRRFDTGAAHDRYRLWVADAPTRRAD